MRSIQDWQKEISSAAQQRFPNNIKWSEQDRVLSITRQVGDVGGAIQKEQGILSSDKHEYDEVNHRIACLIADILILCEKRNIDIDKELGRVLDWFKK